AEKPQYRLHHCATLSSPQIDCGDPRAAAGPCVLDGWQARACDQPRLFAERRESLALRAEPALGALEANLAHFVARCRADLLASGHELRPATPIRRLQYGFPCLELCAVLGRVRALSAFVDAGGRCHRRHAER